MGNAPCHDCRQRERRGEKSRAKETIGQGATHGVTEREGNQDHANLADPNVKRAAEILGQKTRPNNFQHHHRESAEEDEQGRSDSEHATSLG